MLKNPAQAEEWLRKLAGNAMTMTSLRDIVGKAGQGSLNVMDNGAVIKLIALQICSGQLRVCSTPGFGASSGFGAGAGDPGQSAGAVDSKPFPLSEVKKRPASSSSDDRPADPSTLSDDVDGQAQAAALASAADQGQPFCPE